ncbi:MAG: hypothetical protein CMC15_18790 [Flavobacteriaceae bacterium]|nr:hypothetical protein [Flavobacteriaceae bacterium]
MSDLENISDLQDEVTIPAEVVPTEAEASDPAQVEDEVTEFYIEEEGGQTKAPNNFDDPAKRRAAFRDLKAKLREANKLVDKYKSESEEKDRIIEALKNRGSQPEMHDFEDTETFIAAYKEWDSAAGRSAAPPRETKQEKTAEAKSLVNEDNVMALKRGGISDYAEAEADVIDAIDLMGAPGVDVINGWRQLAEIADINAENAIYMISKNPSALDELNNCSSHREIAKILKRESSKLKTRPTKSTQTKPEPNVGSGAIKDSNPMSKYGSYE